MHEAGPREKDPDLARPSSHSILLAALLMLSLALNFAGIDFGQPRHFDQSVDAVHPALALDAVEHLFGQRSRAGLKYPRLHFLMVGAVQRAWLHFRHGGAEAQRIRAEIAEPFRDPSPLVRTELRDRFRPSAPAIGELIVVGRSVSALFGTGAVLGLFLFARALLGAGVAFVAAFSAATAYPLVYYAHTLNTDAAYLCWSMFALWLLVRAVRGGRAADLVLAAVLAACAVATKDQAYGLFLLTAPLALVLLARPGELAREPRRPFPWRAAALALAAAVVVYALALGLPFDLAGVREHFRHIFQEGSESYRAFEPTLAGQALLLGETGLHLLDGLGILVVAALAGAIALGVARDRRRALLLLLVPALSYHATFVAPIGYTYLRFTLPVLLLALILAAVPIVELARFRWLKAFLMLGVLLVLALRMDQCVRLVQLLPRDPREAAARYLESWLEPGAVVGALLELPLHNLELPARARVVDLERPPAGLGADPPRVLVLSSFDPQLSIRGTPELPPAQKELRQFGRSYDFEVEFAPAGTHRIRRGAAFQPTVRIYRLRPAAAGGGG